MEAKIKIAKELRESAMTAPYKFYENYNEKALQSQLDRAYLELTEAKHEYKVLQDLTRLNKQGLRLGDIINYDGVVGVVCAVDYFPKFRKFTKKGVLSLNLTSICYDERLEVLHTSIYPT